MEGKSQSALTKVAGVGVAAILLQYVPQFEGMVLRGYRDPIGIVTACAGHTQTAVLGRAYTIEECRELLRKDLAVHAVGALKCLRVATGDYQLAAFISFTFNVGIYAFCNSTLARRWNAGEGIAACAELSRWIYAGNRQLPGLVNRRKIERAMCEGALK